MKKNLLTLTICLVAAITTLTAQENFFRCTGAAKHPVKTPDGYTMIPELGYAMGLGEVKVPYSSNQITATFTYGYHFKPNFLAGAGTGIQGYSDGSMIPLFLTARYYYKLDCMNPFVMTNAGVLFPVAGEEADIGPFLFLGGGIRIPLDRSLSLTAAAGPYAHWTKPEWVRDALIAVRVGLVFH